MARAYLFWTDDEDQALRDGFALGEKIPELMARVPGRTELQVKKRLYHLGLYRRPWGDYRPPEKPKLGTFGDVPASR